MSTITLHLMHCSMQYSDTAKQKKQDVVDIFTRADERRVSWITGTESAESPLKDLIADVGKAHGFRVHRWRGNWIAVRSLHVRSGTWEKGDVFVAPSTQVAGIGHDAGFAWVEFEYIHVGQVAIAAGHYPTKGRKPGDPNYQINRKYARKVGDWAREKGLGRKLAFYGGDQNIVDRTDDTFFGQPLTSLWDELKKWEDTGHGNIDVIASYDLDRRVKAKYIRALDDKEFPQHSDHYVIEGGYDVTMLK